MSKQVITFVVKEEGIIQKHGSMINSCDEIYNLDTADSVIQVFVEYFNLENSHLQCLSCEKFSPFGNFAILRYEDTDIVNLIEVYWSQWV